MTQKTTLKHRLEALLIWVLPFALRPLPFVFRVKAGGWLIGPILRVLPPLRRRLSDNLDLIYPRISKTEKRAFLRRISKHIGRQFMRIFYNADFHNRPQDVEFTPSDLGQIRKAQRDQRPVILISGHFGQWEAPRLVLKSQGLESGAMYKKSSNPIFERHHHNSIIKGGEPLVMAGTAGTRAMVKHLKSSGIVAILLDQAYFHGEVLDFFGLPAMTSTGPAELALKYNALLVPCYGIIRADGQKIDVVFEPAIPHSDAKTMTQALNDSLTARVKTNPEQWYWLHRRWKMPG